MVDLKLYETDDGLYYKWKFRLDTGETDPSYFNTGFQPVTACIFSTGYIRKYGGLITIMPG